MDLLGTLKEQLWLGERCPYDVVLCHTQQPAESQDLVS
jgi:hypothetical protein